MTRSEKPPTPWAGGVSIGRYLLLREIARGGMGEIWLAHHLGPAGFERLVVLKRIITSPDDDPSMVSMFLDEARIVSQLHHPNVVQVSELGQDGGSYYLVMEYLAGQTLGRVARRLHERGTSMPLSLALEVVADAARGLGYAHRRKNADGRPLEIVHRDVSPQNIFVSYEGHTKVLDFGIASAAGRRTRTATGVLKGKVAYMSPEQALESVLSPQVDVFALGVMLFELVTNSRLYEGADDIVILGKLVSGDALPRASDRVRLDQRLDDLIATAMAWDPLDRFSDGEAMAEQLDDYRKDLPVEQRTVLLRTAIREAFAEEIEQLPAFQRVTQLTPSPQSNESLPSTGVPAMAPPPRRPMVWIRAAVFGVVALATAIGVGAARRSQTAGVPPAPQPSLVQARVDAGAQAPALGALTLDDVRNDAQPQAVAESALPDAGHFTQNRAVARAGTGPAKLARKGKLSLETEPWTKVYLGKRLLGETPLLEVPLPAGLQRLRVRNADEGIDALIEVDIIADSVVVKRLAL